VSEPTRRLAALVEYDGTAYAGWQSQAQAVSIQDAVDAAVSFVAGHKVTTICAGRTDKGVHALGQVIHFDTQASRTPRAWVLGANTRLPPDIALRWAGEVAESFHARHDAVRREYRYCILNRSERSALQRLRAAWVPKLLDVSAMHAAAQSLIGEYDFSAFRSVECQSKTPMREVFEISVRREADLVWLIINANAYLHHMVRNIVGTLIEAQLEAHPAQFVEAVLQSRDRRKAGFTAPPEGLYLWRVYYPPGNAIPELPQTSMLPPA
jgi:tRNA pseudouridine38-40 synthase